MQMEKAFIVFTIAFVAAMLGTVLTLPPPDSNIVTDQDTKSQIQAELLARQDAAYKNFVERNNFHQIRISEYEKYWGDPSINQTLEQILDGIKEERSILEKFEPATQTEAQWSKIGDEFRQINDHVVSSLVEILLEEYDYQMSQVPQSNLPVVIKATESLAAQRTIASQITATSFPTAGDRNAELAGIMQNTVVSAEGIVLATIDLGVQTEQNVKVLEENGIDTRQRHDVREVGTEKNTMQVLFSIIKCQQELRIDAEEYMDASVEASMPL